MHSFMIGTKNVDAARRSAMRGNVLIELASRGLSLYVTRRGDQGPLVVFVPGAGADHLGWGVSMRLLRDDVRSVAYDPRGTGRTGGDANQSGVEVLVGDLVALVDSLGEPVHLVAHSLGTRVAMGAAARAPERVRSLFLFAPWYRGDPFMDHRQDMLYEVCQKGDRRIAAQTLLWLLTSRALQVEEPERFDQYLEAMFLGERATPWPTILRQLRAGRDEPIGEDELDGLTVPVRVLVAEHDRMIEPPTSEALADRLGADVVRLSGPRASHLAHVEMAEAFAQLVRDWLGQVASA
jgi:aminoacrylate hydrolase